MPNYVINTIALTGKQSDLDSICELLKNKTPDADEQIDFNNVVLIPNSMHLVAGGDARWYIASYVRTLSDEEKRNLIQELLKYPAGFYKSYFHKYKEAFNEDIPVATIHRLEETFKRQYSAINPSSIEEVGKTYINNILNYGADTWYDWSNNNWGTKKNAMNSSISDNIIEFDTANSAALPITEKLSKLYPDVRFSHEWADEDIGQNCGRYVFKNGIVISEYLPQGKEAVAFACDKWGYDAVDYGVDINDYDFRDIVNDNMNIIDARENLPLKNMINSAMAVSPKEQAESVKTKTIESEQHLR